MRDERLYVDSHGDDEDRFYGEGAPPPLTSENRCRCGGTMRVAIAPVTIGKPPLASWDWLCRACGRSHFGGRWRQGDEPL